MRKQISELIDDPGLDPETHRRAMADLTRLNVLSRGAQVLFNPVLELSRRKNLKKLSLLDVGTGNGDLLCSILRASKQAGIELEGFGCDINQSSLHEARTQSRQQNVEAEFFYMDAVNDPFPRRFDIICMSLFTHHLTEEQIVKMLTEARSAVNHLILVNDLVRSPLNLMMVKVATRILTKSPVVRVDGPASVENSFTRSEMSALGSKAGLNGHKVTLHFPCRMLLQWARTDD